MGYKLEIGDKAPDFSLIATDGMIYTLKQFKGARGIVVFFTCNHCPYVKGSLNYMKSFYEKFHQRGVEFIAINSNSPVSYPKDSYEAMVEASEIHRLPWPYLHDATQNVAKDFGAICTPHFFLFNQGKNLIYSGRGLDNPKNPEQSTSDDLKNALEELLESKAITEPTTDPIGCSIKWEATPENVLVEECALV